MKAVPKGTRSKFKELSAYEYGQISGAFEFGNVSVADIARRMNLPSSTVSGCVKRIKKRGTALPEHSGGRPKKLSDTTVRAVARNMKKSPEEPLRYHNEFLHEGGIDVADNTLRNYLKEK